MSDNANSQGKPAEKPFRVVLASASPRRRELLEQAGVTFTVHASEVDESLEPDLLANPPEACKKLAERKAGAVVQEILADPAFEGMLIVIGSDTMVVKDGNIFGKPKSASDATHMLRRLSGATHEVITAVSVWVVSAEAVDPALAADDDSGNISLGFRTFCDTSRVTFHELTDERIREYLACGESFDKAGAYGILEPKMNCALVTAADIDFAVVPCLSFDRKGRRLGQGGGYYDRLLPQLRCPTALICREQLMSPEVPVEEHDMRCTMLITEKGILTPEA